MNNRKTRKFYFTLHQQLRLVDLNDSSLNYKPNFRGTV